MDRAAASEPSRGEGVSPLIAFGIALLLVVGLVGAWMLSRPDDPPPVTGQPSGSIEEPDYSLTTAEAIARFKELSALRLEAIEERRVSLLADLLTDDSPLNNLLRSDIKELRSSGVVVKSQFDTRRIEVLSLDDTSLVIRQVVLQAPQFKTEAGEPVRSTSPQLRVIDWTLHLEGSTWKIFDSEIVRSRTTKK